MSEAICVAATALIACLDLAGHVHGLGDFMARAGWYPMTALAQISLWLCLSCLLFPQTRHLWLVRQLSLAAAMLVVGLHLSTLFFLGNQALAHQFPRCGLPAVAIATNFVLIGAALLAIDTQRRFLIHCADLFTLLSCLLSMVLTTGALIGTLPFFHAPGQQPCAPAGILACLSLLSLGVLFRRTDRGLFSILLFSGIAGRFSRRLLPVILLFPFVREAARARLIGAKHIPPPYITALLASAASIILLCLVLYCAWRIHAMEKEIRTLSLCDPLTGLYNLRGFELLAKHAYQIAQRSQLPFAVLFLDLDGLKSTNDTFGHAAGSQALVATGEILDMALRETDVIGHVGGDEFVVAGQFSEGEVTQVLERIEQCRREKNAASKRGFPICFSLGYAIANADSRETLEALQARADKAMYAVKRRKKQAAAQRDAEKEHPELSQLTLN